MQRKKELPCHMLSIVCLYILKRFIWKWRFSTMKKAQHQTSFFQFLIFLDQCLQVLVLNLSKGSFFVSKNFHIKSIYWYCWYEHYHTAKTKWREQKVNIHVKRNGIFKIFKFRKKMHVKSYQQAKHSDSNGIRTQIHLVQKRIFKTSLDEWLSVRLETM